jgi:hypothetical protein
MTQKARRAARQSAKEAAKAQAERDLDTLAQRNAAHFYITSALAALRHGVPT